MKPDSTIIKWQSLSLLQFRQAEKFFYDPTMLASSSVIKRFTSSGLQLAYSYEISGNSQMQEEILLEVFSGLHSAVVNPTRHILFRYHSLYEIRSVFEALSCVYKDVPEDRYKLSKIIHILSKTRLSAF